jgi:hypothetical protein
MTSPSGVGLIAIMNGTYYKSSTASTHLAHAAPSRLCAGQHPPRLALRPLPSSLGHRSLVHR